MIISNPPIDPPKIGSVDRYSLTFEEVEARLVETMVLWRRSPGGGKWPYAKDAPWHLMSKHTSLGDYDDRHGNEDARPKAVPLSLAEVEERDRVSEWLRFVPDRDRKLVVLALMQKANGAEHVSWTRIRRQLPDEISPFGLSRRYSKAITKIVRALKMADFRRDGASRQFATS